MSLKRLYHSGLFIRLPIEHTELTPEIRLHRSVLDQALLDLFSPDWRIKRDASSWLDLDNEDFVDACNRADLDPTLCYTLFIQIKKILKDQVSVDPFKSI